MAEKEYFERYISQIAVIGRRGQRKLQKTRVHIAGLGGLGNLLAFFLSTAGVGYISANDPQRLEPENLGRFVCGEEADVGRYKVHAAERFFLRNPNLAFEPVVAKNESRLADPFFERADWIFSCGNTIASRVVATRKAVELAKPIIDVGVADGRKSLSGSIKYWLPECAAWSACPACYVIPNIKIPRNEGLLFSVLAITAALAAHLLVCLVTGVNADKPSANNCLTVELGKIMIENLAVLKRKLCPVCSNR